MVRRSRRNRTVADRPDGSTLQPKTNPSKLRCLLCAPAPREYTSYPVASNFSLNMSELPPAVVKRLTNELIELQVNALRERAHEG